MWSLMRLTIRTDRGTSRGRVPNLPGQERSRIGLRDRLGVRLEREVPGVEEADVGIGDVALETPLRRPGRKKGSFLPQTARNRGRCLRK